MSVVFATRLYAILDIDLTLARGLSPAAVAAAWLDAGVRVFQLRGKSMAGAAMLELADGLRLLADQAGATFIVNDRADIARMSGAAGVHVGQGDLAPADARVVVGDAAVIGVSTHNPRQILAAVAEPVDYVAIGPVFTTLSKARPDPVVGLDGVRRASEITTRAALPLVAIGGLTLARAKDTIDAGASAVAVISDLLAADPGRRAAEFLRALR